MAGRLSILYYTGPVLMMLPPCCGWSVCSIVVYYKDTAHIFFLRRERDRENNIVGLLCFRYGLFHCCGALSWFFRRCIIVPQSQRGEWGEEGENKNKKTRVIEFALTFFFLFFSFEDIENRKRNWEEEGGGYKKKKNKMDCRDYIRCWAFIAVR